jgi:hypothetical protein
MAQRGTDAKWLYGDIDVQKRFMCICNRLNVSIVPHFFSSHNVQESGYVSFSN